MQEAKVMTVPASVWPQCSGPDASPIDYCAPHDPGISVVYVINYVDLEIHQSICGENPAACIVVVIIWR